MLNGFTLDEKWISLPEDEGEPKTEFLVRSIPAGKYDELQGESFELSQMLGKGLDGAAVARRRAFAREYVRWGIAGHRNGAGGLAECKTEKRTYAGQEFVVLSDETLTIYERTQVGTEPIFEGNEEIGKRRIFLLDRLFQLVQQAQTLTLDERRGLRGADLAGA